MDANLKRQRLLYSAWAVEYGFLAVLLSSIIGIMSGLLVALVCAAVHLAHSKRTRIVQKWFKCFTWLLWAGLVDFFLISFGMLCRLQLIGGRVFGNLDALLGIGEAALQLAAGVAGVRLSTTIAIKLIGIKPESMISGATAAPPISSEESAPPPSPEA